MKGGGRWDGGQMQKGQPKERRDASCGLEQAVAMRIGGAEFEGRGEWNSGRVCTDLRVNGTDLRVNGTV